MSLAADRRSPVLVQNGRPRSFPYLAFEFLLGALPEFFLWAALSPPERFSEDIPGPS